MAPCEVLFVSAERVRGTSLATNPIDGHAWFDCDLDGYSPTSTAILRVETYCTTSKSSPT